MMANRGGSHRGVKDCVRFCVCILLGVMSSVPVHAGVTVTDDRGQVLRLAHPARRIVSLAPNVAETLFAIGAGSRLVGAVDYTDYPAAAKKIPRVGSYSHLDLEAIVALKPDLVIAWETGNPPAQVDRLRALGLPVYVTEPGHIDDVARDMERYGVLAGLADSGRQAATTFRNRLADLRHRYGGRPPVRTFYQIWKDPLMTVGGPQIITDALKICGGENIFGALRQMAPTVTVESVLAANPEVIVASGDSEARPRWLDEWRRWPRLTAVKRDNLYAIPPDLIQRHTPRILDGTGRLCDALENARSKRDRFR